MWQLGETLLREHQVPNDSGARLPHGRLARVMAHLMCTAETAPQTSVGHREAQARVCDLPLLVVVLRIYCPWAGSHQPNGGS